MSVSGLSKSCEACLQRIIEGRVRTVRSLLDWRSSSIQTGWRLRVELRPRLLSAAMGDPTPTLVGARQASACGRTEVRNWRLSSGLCDVRRAHRAAHRALCRRGGFTPSESGVCWRIPERAGPVDHGDHVHLSLVNLVDDAVRSFKNLSDSLAIVLGHTATRPGKRPDLARPCRDAIHRS